MKDILLCLGKINKQSNRPSVANIIRQYSRTPLIQKMFIRSADYPDRLDPLCKSVENCTKIKLP
jgi:hypothetical protein